MELGIIFEKLEQFFSHTTSYAVTAWGVFVKRKYDEYDRQGMGWIRLFCIIVFGLPVIVAVQIAFYWYTAYALVYTPAKTFGLVDAFLLWLLIAAACLFYWGCGAFKRHRAKKALKDHTDMYGGCDFEEEEYREKERKSYIVPWSTAAKMSLLLFVFVIAQGGLRYVQQDSVVVWSGTCTYAGVNDDGDFGVVVYCGDQGQDEIWRKDFLRSYFRNPGPLECRVFATGNIRCDHRPPPIE